VDAQGRPRLRCGGASPRKPSKHQHACPGFQRQRPRRLPAALRRGHLPRAALRRGFNRTPDPSPLVKTTPPLSGACCITSSAARCGVRLPCSKLRIVVASTRAVPAILSCFQSSKAWAVRHGAGVIRPAFPLEIASQNALTAS
jgi:hypothetical protein